MKLINVILMSEDLPKVNEEIILEECLHPISVDLVSDCPSRLDSFYNSALIQEYRDFNNRVKKLASLTGVELKYSPETVKYVKDNLSEFTSVKINNALSNYEAQVNNISGRKNVLENKLSTVKDVESQYGIFKNFIDALNVSNYSVLDQFVGQLPTGTVDELKLFLDGTPHVFIPVTEASMFTTFILFVLKKDSVRINKKLHELNYQHTTLPVEFKGPPNQILDRIKKNYDSAKKELDILDKKYSEVVSEINKNLIYYAYHVSFQSLIIESQQYFKKTAKTCVLSGWVPEENSGKLINRVKEITNGKCYIELVDPESLESDKVKVPYQFKNNMFAKPFEMIVKTYGIPAYKTIDPTPFLAFSYVFMFGYMFGDVGDGLCLTAMGLFLLLNKKYKPVLRQVGALLTYCGASSIIFGFLYGSFFGLEGLFPHLWLNPMHDVNKLLTCALYFGMGMISLGIILNVINGIRMKNWTHAIFDKSGLLGGLIYWGAIGLLFKAFFLKHHLAGWTVFLFLVLPILLLLLKAPFAKMVGYKKYHYEGLGSYLMEYCLELLEIFQGYLANTFSFIRVGAFALSHAGLFVAIFSIEEMVKGASFGSALAWMVVIFGNILILLFEAMIVAIQVIRLEYYEFFSKFFVGEGIAYKPLSINENK